MRLRHALISVSDKTGLGELGAALAAAGVKIYSTGGTAAALEEAGCAVESVGDLTGYDDMLDGRVKTLHPNVHAALLADMQNPGHSRELEAHGLPKIDLLVVNFYPFEQTASAGASEQEVIENIDIGGPAMVRAAAKNHRSTLVMTDPGDYPVFIGRLKKNAFDLPFRRQLAAKAFTAVAQLDAAIANHFNRAEEEGGGYPPHQFIHLRKFADLAYGENPHQSAACYYIAGEPRGFTQLHGAPLSYNNLLDAHSAWTAVSQFGGCAAAVIKHNNPCGIGVGKTLKAAFARALQTDPQAAFGGVVAFSQPLDEEAALLVQESFYEVVIAPQFDAAAKSVLAPKERLRLLLAPPAAAAQQQLTSIGALVLAQQGDRIGEAYGAENIVSQRPPSAAELADLRFAWRAAAVVKSNAVVLARRCATIGIGAGQMSRVDSARLACEKAARARLKTAGSVAASDGFFPFADGVEALAAAGVAAVIQPGGSKNDAEVIAAADAAGMAMVMTGRRHFRH